MKKRAKRRPRLEGCESKIEHDLFNYWKRNFKEPIVQQHQFHPERAWRFDFCFPSAYVAVEVQGYGTGHTSYTGMHRDYEKHNAAMALGWGIVYVMSKDLLPDKISKTCSFILKIITTRKNNEFLMRGIHGLGTVSNKTIECEGVSPSDKGRGGLLERLNQFALSQRDDKLRKARGD